MVDEGLNRSWRSKNVNGIVGRGIWFAFGARGAWCVHSGPKSHFLELLRRG